MSQRDAWKSASDAELVAAARDHRRAAFKALFSRHRKAVFRTVGRHATTEDEARDLMREAFVAVFRNLHMFDESLEDFDEWAGRIAAAQARRIAHDLPSSASSADDGEPLLNPDQSFWQDLWSSVKLRLPSQVEGGPPPSRDASPTLPERALPAVATPKARPRNQPRVTQATEYAEEQPSLTSSGPDGQTLDGPVPEHVVPLQPPVDVPAPSLEVEVACAAATGAPVPFGAYEILGEVARGGMGIVLRARDTRLDRMVAIKVLKAGPDATERQVRRFRREALAAARLHHPGIVTVHDVGRERGYPFLTMELVDGIALDDWILANKPAPKEVVRLVAEVSRALQHAHDCGLVHRDLKPANVLVTRTGKAKVTDFGLAQVDLQGLDGSGRLTRTGAAVGTPFYMSPEQVRGERDVDPRADIWALGVVLYECLTGTMPFTGTTVVEVYREIVDHDPKRASHWNPQVSKNLDIIIDRCMEKEREDRYLTADDVAADLEGILIGRAPSKPPTNTGRQRRRLARHIRKRSSLIAASLCGSLALAATGIAISGGLAPDLKKEAAEQARALEQAEREVRSSYDQHLLVAEAALDDARAALARHSPADAHEAAGRARASLGKAEAISAPADMPTVSEALAAAKQENRPRWQSLLFEEALLHGDSLAGMQGQDWSTVAEQYDLAHSRAGDHHERRHLARLRRLDLLLINRLASDVLKELTGQNGAEAQDLQIRRALALELLGRYTDAEAVYESLATQPAGGRETPPDLATAARLGHARSLLATGNPEAALEMLERDGPAAWDNQPRPVRLLHIDCLSADRDRLDAARREADKGWSKHPDEPATGLSSARVLILLNRLDEAKARLEEAREAGAGIAADLGLGVIAERQLDVEKAREIYERIVAAAPKPETDQPGPLRAQRLRDLQESILALSLAVAEQVQPATPEVQARARHRIAVITTLDHADKALKLAQRAAESPEATLAALLRHARLLTTSLLDHSDNLPGPDTQRAGHLPALQRASDRIEEAQGRLDQGHPRHDEADLLAVGLLEARPLKLTLAMERLRLAIARHVQSPDNELLEQVSIGLKALEAKEFQAHRDDMEVLLLRAQAHEASGETRQARALQEQASNRESSNIDDRRSILYETIRSFRLWQRSHKPEVADQTMAALSLALETKPGSSVSWWILQQLRTAPQPTGEQRAGSAALDRAIARNSADSLARLAKAQQRLSEARELIDTDLTAGKALAKESYTLAISALDGAQSNASKMVPHQHPRIEARRLAVQASWLLAGPAAAMEELDRHADYLSEADPGLRVPALQLEVALLEELGPSERLERAKGQLKAAWSARAERITSLTYQASNDPGNDYMRKRLSLLDEAIALGLSGGPQAMNDCMAEAYWARGVVSLSDGYGSAALLDSVRAAARSGHYTDELFKKITNNKDVGETKQLLSELRSAITASHETSPEHLTLLTARTLISGFCQQKSVSPPDQAIAPAEQQLSDLEYVLAAKPDHILALCLRPLIYLHAHRYNEARASLERLGKRWGETVPAASPQPPALFILAQAFQNAEDGDLRGFARKLTKAVDARGLLAVNYIMTTPYRDDILKDPKLKTLWRKWQRKAAKPPG